MHSAPFTHSPHPWGSYRPVQAMNLAPYKSLRCRCSLDHTEARRCGARHLESCPQCRTICGHVLASSLAFAHASDSAPSGIVVCGQVGLLMVYVKRWIGERALLFSAVKCSPHPWGRHSLWCERAFEDSSVVERLGTAYMVHCSGQWLRGCSPQYV